MTHWWIVILVPVVVMLAGRLLNGDWYIIRQLCKKRTSADGTQNGCQHENAESVVIGPPDQDAFFCFKCGEYV